LRGTKIVLNSAIHVPGRTYLAIVSLLIILACNHKNNYAYTTLDYTYDYPTKALIKTPHIFQNDHKSCATTSVAIAVSYFLGLTDAPLDKDIVWKISVTKEETIVKSGNDMNGLQKITDFYGLKGEYKNNISIIDLKYLLAHNKY